MPDSINKIVLIVVTDSQQKLTETLKNMYFYDDSNDVKFSQ